MYTLFAAATVWRQEPKTEVVVTFSASPHFNKENKKRIILALDRFRSYLVSIGYDVPKHTPPLGTSADMYMSGSAGRGMKPEYGHMVIPETTLDNPDDAAIRVYSIYLFSHLIPEEPPNDKIGSLKGMATRIFADYYRSSFYNRRQREDPAELDRWEAVIWEIRDKHGKEFMDKAVFYAIKRWQPYGFDRTDKDFNSYFSSRIAAGVAALDNNGYPLDEIRKLLKERGFSPP
jgi:hypothetical protein